MQKEWIKTAWLVAMLCLTACSVGVKHEQQVAPIRVRTQVVKAQPQTASLRYVGTVEARREIPLSIQTAGRVLCVNVKDGEQVSKGQVLLCVDSTQAVNALRSAEAAYIHAKDGYDRAKQVHEKGVVTSQKMCLAILAKSQCCGRKSICGERAITDSTILAICSAITYRLNSKCIFCLSIKTIHGERKRSL